MRSTVKKKARNQSLTSLAKTNVVKAEKVISSGDLEAAKKSVTTAVTTLDRAAERGIIHPNNAARRKSRLVKKLNAIAPKAKATPANDFVVAGIVAIDLLVEVAQRVNEPDMFGAGKHRKFFVAPKAFALFLCDFPDCDESPIFRNCSMLGNF